MPVYEEYIKSEKWTKFRRRYRASGFPQFCLACCETNYTLHHLTYKNLGREKLTDVAPLCWHCHQKIHAAGYKFALLSPLARFAKQLNLVFGISKAKVSELLKPWSDRRFDRRVSRKQRKEMKKTAKRQRDARQNRDLHERMCKR